MTESRTLPKILARIQAAFGSRNLSSRPVAVSLGVFLVVMAVLGTAWLVASLDERVVAGMVYAIFKALMFLVFVAAVLAGLARGVQRAFLANERYRQERAAEALPASQESLLRAAIGPAGEDPYRADMARRLLEDDTLFERVKTSELRRLKDAARRMRPDEHQ